MSNRRKRANAKNKSFAYIAAGLVHLVIIVLLLFNFANKPKTTQAAYAEKLEKIVTATTVDESAIKKQQDMLKKAELEREREKKKELERLKKIKEDAKKEKDNLDKLKKQREQEKKKADDEAAERKAIALKKKKEEEERKKRVAEEKRKAEDKRKKEEQRKAEEKRKRDEETQRLLDESLAAEEAFQAERMAKERATNLLGKYTALITEKVKSKWSVSPSFERWRKAKVSVKLSPSGDVQSVAIVESSGSQQFDRSVETAVRQAAPLPIPTVEEDPEVNKLFQTLTFNIDMSGM